MSKEIKVIDREMEAEEMTATEKLKKLKRWGITIGIALVVLIIAAFLVNRAAEKRVTAKYEATVTELNERVEELESRPAISSEVTKEVNLSLLNTQIQEIGELATVEYLYTDAGKFSDSKEIGGIKVGVTTKSFVAKWDGVIKAGVDVTKIITDLNEGTKEITVHMPKAEILSHEIDENSVETLDEKDGWFNPVRVEDVREFDSASKGEMENRAIERGILETAEKNAETVIRKILNAIPNLEETYTVTFVWDAK